MSAPPGATADSSDGLVPDWVKRLSSAGPERHAATSELHAMLLRVTRIEVDRWCASYPHLCAGDHEDIARQSADDALMSILRRLGDFRGESRFTTWAYKFAVLEAGVKVRRHAWRGREIPVDEAVWPLIPDDGPSPHQLAEAQVLLTAVREEIQSTLTSRQREVLVAIVLNEVPIDVLAERLSCTRGAVYKTLHDARQKLRAALAARGLGIDGDKRGEDRER